MNNKLMVGWSEADITPVTDKFISLSGQYYVRLTKEIHSRLKTVAVAFSSGDRHFLMASMDNVGVEEAFQKLVGAFPFKRRMVGTAVRYRNTDVIQYLLNLPEVDPVEPNNQ